MLAQQQRSGPVAGQSSCRDDHHELAVHVCRVGEPVDAERDHAEAHDHNRRRVREGGEDRGPVVSEGSRCRRRSECKPGGDEGEPERGGVGKIVPRGRHKAGRMSEGPASGFDCDEDQIDDESQYEPARSRHGCLSRLAPLR